MSAALNNYDFFNGHAFDDMYISLLNKRDKEIGHPVFKNERKFGYIITDEVELKRLLNYIRKLNPRIRCFDTETTNEEESIRKARMVGFSLSFGREKWQNFYIPCGHTVTEPYGQQIPIYKLMQFIEEVLLEAGIVLGAHNMSYDCHILANHGLHLLKHTRRLKIKLYDTMIASWIVDENQFKALKFQARLRLRGQPYVKDMLEYKDVIATVPTDVKRKHGLKASQNATIDLVSIDIAGDYAINDSRAVIDLIPVYELIMLREAPLHDRFHFFEMDYFYEAYKMERRGTRLNLPLLKQYKKDITKHIAELEDKLYKAVGYSFSVRSNKALPHLLYTELGFPVLVKTDSGNPSTDKEAFEGMLDYRRTLLNPMKEQIAKLEKKKVLKPVQTKKLKRLKREAAELEKKLDIVKLIQDIRLLRHLDSNFITGLLERQVKGIIYPRFNQAGTVTGRLSSSDPNGQNIPTDVKDTDPRHRYSIRDLFIPRKGYVMLVADFSNLELRILAHIARDETLIRMFLNKEDPHSSTAISMNTTHRLVKLGITASELKKLASVDKTLQTIEHSGNLEALFAEENKSTYELMDKYFYKDVNSSSLKDFAKKTSMKDLFKMLWRLFKEAKDLRGEGKLLNFAIIYGFGDDAIAKSLGLPTAEQGRKKKIDYFNAFKGVYNWVQKIRRVGEKKGFVETLLGKRRRKPSALQASNAPIQGTAGDIVKMAQVKLGRNPMLRSLGFHQLLQVHDEIVAEVKEEHAEKAKAWMRRILEHPLNEDLVVPLISEPEIGMTWNEAK